MSLASEAAASSAWSGFSSPYIALPRWSLSDSSIFGHFGLAITLATPHFIWSAKPLRIGFFSARRGEFSSDVRGGSVVPFGLPNVHFSMFAGVERNSTHFHAASCCLPPDGMTSVSPAIVVAQPWLPSGSGAAAHLPSSLGYSPVSVLANQAPAMYIATLPLANATRPSYEFELRKSLGEYFVSPT